MGVVVNNSVFHPISSQNDFLVNVRQPFVYDPTVSEVIVPYTLITGRWSDSL